MSEAVHFRDLRDMLENTEKLYQNEVAFKMKYKGSIVEIKYSKFIEDVKHLGSYLLNLELKNNRIAIISNNRYEWSVAYLATATSDLIAVPLDRSLPENEFHSLIERSEAEVIIYESKYEPFIQAEKENPNSSLRTYINMDTDLSRCYDEGKVIYNRKNSPYKKVKIANDKMRFMLFTSGTTSTSKCVMLSHKNICSDIEQITKTLEIGTEDTLLSFLPIHHTFECTAGFLFPISRGSTIAYCEGLRHIADNIKEFDTTVMICVPAVFEGMYKKVWKAIKDGKKEAQIKAALKASKMMLKVGIDIRKTLFKQIHEKLGEKVRFFVSGAAGINPEVLKGFNDFGIALYQGYGLTETSPVICTENAEYRRAGSVGIPFENIDVKIEDPDEEGIGEIVVKSPMVMLGYYQNEEATKEVLSHGWFKTGDLGKLDKDGYLYITGRKKDVIVLKNGKNVFPEELETLINNNIEGIKESIVYGATLNDGDVELRAKLVYDEDAVKSIYNTDDEDELKDILWEKIKEVNKKVSTYKYIKNIIISDEELIKTTTNKVKRFEEIKKILEE